MLKKYVKQLDNIFEYIRNRIVAGVSPDLIVSEIRDRFSPEILYPDASTSTLASILKSLVLCVYFMHHNTTYKEEYHGTINTTDPAAGIA